MATPYWWMPENPWDALAARFVLASLNIEWSAAATEQERGMRLMAEAFVQHVRSWR